MKWLTLVAVLFLAGCGTGSKSSVSIQPTSTPTPTVTSVTVAPATASVIVGGTAQFTATAAGTGNYSSGVTWSVTGNGTISTTGLYTGGSTTGTAFVTATSTQDTSVSGQGQVTITPAPIQLYGWSGSLGGVQVDFDLTQTGTALTSPAVLVAAQTFVSGCSNILTNPANGPAEYGKVLQGLPTMSGSLTGQSVVLSFINVSLASTQNNASDQKQPFTLSGTLGTDNQGYGVITGTFSAPAGGCFPNGATNEPFTLNQYQETKEQVSYPIIEGHDYVGTFTGLAGGLTQDVPATLTAGEFYYAATSNFPASPVYDMNWEHACSFFHLWGSLPYPTYVWSVPTTNLVVWGFVSGPDSQGTTLYPVYLGTAGPGTIGPVDPTTPMTAATPGLVQQ